MTYGSSSKSSVKRAATLAAVLFLGAASAACALEPLPAMRSQADTARHRVWAITAEGASVHEAASPEGVDIALPGWQWVGGPYACPPALALAPDGAALVTSNVVPVVWRIDPVTLAVTVHRLALNADTDKDIGFSALVYSARHAAYFAMSDVHGSLWQIDAQLRSAHKMKTTTAYRHAVVAGHRCTLDL